MKNMKDKLSIALYTSTKGHFGYKDCYKHTIRGMEEFFEDSFEDLFKIAHVKISPNEIDLFPSMKEYLEEKGFLVLSTQADWSHNDISHAVEYYKDQLKVYSFPKFHLTPFSIAFEDDWIVKGENIINQGITFLEDNLEILCVRINRDIQKFSNFEYLNTYHKNIKLQSLSATKWGPTFTFQPTIVRTKEWYHALRIINQNQDLLRQTHCELISGHFMKLFSDLKTPFAFFDSGIISVEHIGEEEIIKTLK